MFINKNSIMIKYPLSTGNPKSLGLYQLNNGTFSLTNDTTFQSGKSYYVSMGQYLLSAKYEFNKLWGEDTGRNLKGKFTGTLVGIFPKLILTFRKLSKSELNLLAPILDSATQTIIYYDPNNNTNKTISTYSGDWSVQNNYISKNESFEISFISREKRS